jgi:hypothetical protein
LQKKKTRCNKECVSEIIFNPESGEEVEGTEYVVTPHYGVQTGLTDQKDKVYKSTSYAEVLILLRIIFYGREN